MFGGRFLNACCWWRRALARCLTSLRPGLPVAAGPVAGVARGVRTWCRSFDRSRPCSLKASRAVSPAVWFRTFMIPPWST